MEARKRPENKPLPARRGYNAAMPLVDPFRVLAALGPAAACFDVRALEICDSTNSEVQRLAAMGMPSGLVVIADRQTAGRGRRGRVWLAEPEQGLTFSLLWRFDGSPARLAGLSLAVGVALARAIDTLGIPGVGLKWPNDLLALLPTGPAKVAGILVELSNEPKATQAVIGIGINLLKPSERCDQPAAGLAELAGEPPERHALLSACLGSLAGVLDAFSVGGFAVFCDEWERRHAWAGQTVRVTGEGDAELTGVCRSIGVDGCLLLETPGGLIRVMAGDVSLRRS